MRQTDTCAGDSPVSRPRRERQAARGDVERRGAAVALDGDAQ